MTVKIGDRQLATRRPQDLDRLLLEDTGCNAAEIATMLAGSPLAGLVARALRPFLPEGEAPPGLDLAAEIAEAGTIDVARRVAALYAAAGADDLDGLTGPQLREKAAAEVVDLGGATRVDDMREAIRAARLAKLEQAE